MTRRTIHNMRITETAEKQEKMHPILNHKQNLVQKGLQGKIISDSMANGSIVKVRTLKLMTVIIILFIRNLMCISSSSVDSKYLAIQTLIVFSATDSALLPGMLFSHDSSLLYLLPCPHEHSTESQSFCFLWALTYNIVKSRKSHHTPCHP